MATLPQCNWRLIKDGSHSGPWNMAADDFLLSRAADTTQPALRLYGWSAPTLSLGYFQKLSELPSDWNNAAASIVRRPTGGGAILHHHELTYAVAVPDTLVDGPQLYQQMNQAVLEAVRIVGGSASVRGAVLSERAQRGTFLCFERPGSTDIISPAGKLAGGAQRRIRGAILQHGSLMLQTTQPGSTSLSDQCRRQVSFAEAAAALAIGVSKMLEANLFEDSFSRCEIKTIEKLAASRYGTDEWLQHGNRKSRRDDA